MKNTIREHLGFFGFHYISVLVIFAGVVASFKNSPYWFVFICIGLMFTVLANARSLTLANRAQRQMLDEALKLNKQAMANAEHMIKERLNCSTKESG